ncbi:hypothetical protein ACP70R_004238 [Stipagrostis hirtigluma subsp. patula]
MDIDALEETLHDPTASPIFLPLQFLKSVTCDFSSENLLGSGGFGKVYKGVLRSGKIIAVKKLYEWHLIEDTQFKNEVGYLMEVKHQNVAKLRGYCAESRWEMVKAQNGEYVMAQIPSRLLCFEYLCGKSLDNHITDESSGLDWNQRYEIIIGICGGLNFLHEEHRIVHLDLKPENILMDAMMVPKIADFGLSRLLGQEKSRTIIAGDKKGTRRYMAPEYLNDGVVSPKADIFSFGVIMINIITGHKGYPWITFPYFEDFGENDRRQCFERSLQQKHIDDVLARWRNKFQTEPEYTNLDTYTQQVKQCISVALKCMDQDMNKRPSASDILKMIGRISVKKLRLAPSVPTMVRSGEDVKNQLPCGKMVPPTFYADQGKEPPAEILRRIDEVQAQQALAQGATVSSHAGSPPLDDNEICHGNLGASEGTNGSQHVANGNMDAATNVCSNNGCADHDLEEEVY